MTGTLAECGDDRLDELTNEVARLRLLVDSKRKHKLHMNIPGDMYLALVSERDNTGHTIATIVRRILGEKLL